MLKTRGLALKKRWGQNFLINRGLVKQMAGHIVSQGRKYQRGKRLRVWEIGPGLGAMTSCLLEHELELTVFEIDYGLVNILQIEFSKEIEEKRLHVVSGDVMKSIMAEEKDDDFALPDLICGNLPYSTAVRIMVHIAAIPALYVPAFYLVQKEAALRLMAKAGNSVYGISSVLLQSLFSISKCFGVGRDSFFPPPNVDSLFIQASPLLAAHMGVAPYLALQKLLKSSFSQRRKKLKNTLLPFLNTLALPEPFTEQELLKHYAIDVNDRAEDTEMEAFVRLAIRLAQTKEE